jgi:hypothetical protein
MRRYNIVPSSNIVAGLFVSVGSGGIAALTERTGHLGISIPPSSANEWSGPLSKSH